MTTAVNPFAAPASTPPAQPATPPANPAATDGADPFSGPAPQQPRGPRLQEMYGRLLLILPTKLEEGIVSKFLGTDGKPQVQDRMTADVVILDGGTIQYGGNPEKLGGRPHDKTVEPPHRSTAMFISSKGLISQCREALAKRLAGQPGAMVLGRLAVGEAKTGQAAPYLLTPPTEADKQTARAYLAQVDPFA